MRPILFVLFVAGILFCDAYWKKAHGQPVVQNDMSVTAGTASFNFSNSSTVPRFANSSAWDCTYRNASIASKSRGSIFA